MRARDVLCPKMKTPTTTVMMPHAVRLNLQESIKHMPFIIFLHRRSIHKPNNEQHILVC